MNGSLRETVYYVSETFVRVVNASGTFNFTYIHHEGQLVAQQVGTTTLYIHSNHEGSSSVVTNSTANVVERVDYTPFGEQLNTSRIRFGYEGREYDSLVGDTDFKFRKYRADLGIFTQPDDVIQNVYDPQSLNRYSFERNNPYKYVDKSGHAIQLLYGLVLVTPYLGQGIAILYIAMARGAILKQSRDIIDTIELAKLQEQARIAEMTKKAESYVCTESSRACMDSGSPNAITSQNIGVAIGVMATTQASQSTSKPTISRMSSAASRLDQLESRRTRGSDDITINKDAYINAALDEAEQKWGYLKDSNYQKYLYKMDKAADNARAKANKINNDFDFAEYGRVRSQVQAESSEN